MAKQGNNEGSITKRENGTYLVRVTMPDGSRRTASAKSRTEARTKRDELLHLAEQRARLTPGRNYATFGDYLDVWVATMAPSVKPTTAVFYERYARLHAADLAPIAPEHLKPQHIQQVYAKMLEKGFSTTTVRHLHATLHRAFENGVRQGVFSQNLCELIDAPRIAQKEMRVFSMEQSRQFLAAIQGTRFEALFALALSTGMRRGEILGLTWENVDLDRGIIYVQRNLQHVRGVVMMQEPKTKQGRRHLFLGPIARQALIEHRERQNRERAVMEWDEQKWNLVFTTTKGTPMHPTTLLLKHYDPIIKQAGLPHIRFHDLRHTAATLLLEAGINPKVVSEMLGHSSIAITLALYSHVTPAMQYGAMQAMDRVLSGQFTPPALPNEIEGYTQ
ncbi:MAG: site-specific integrase [Ktedonobacterales bacterium]|nr:site-specific integrase [Ktedonobacterales bacterium]